MIRPVERRRVPVVILAAMVAFAGACMKAQPRTIDRALAPPPVDLRAVPGGVEVGFVCGAAVPRGTLLIEQDGLHRQVQRLLPTKDARPTRTVVVAVPDALRNVRLNGAVSLTNELQRGVPRGIYYFNFRYSDLTHTPKRIPGASCARDVTPSTS